MNAAKIPNNTIESKHRQPPEPLAFLQNSFLLNAGLEHSKSGLIFEQSRLPNNFIFGMLYSGFLPGIFFGEGGKMYCYANFFVMQIFLLFSDQISGGTASVPPQ